MARVSALGQPFGEGASYESLIVGAAPGANTNFALPVDGRWVWRPVSCVFTLTTDANVAARYVTVEARDGDGAPFTVDGAGVTVAASSTQRYAGSVSRTVAEWATGTDVLFPLTPVFLYAGWTYSIIVTNKQAGDALSALRFIFDRFPTGAGELPGSERAADAS